MTAEIIIIATLASLACAIPGIFLLLKRMALISDAISHSILPGIVIGFLFRQSLNTPYPIVGAVLFAMVMVITVETLNRSALVKGDTAIAIVFPPLFSIGVVLVSLYANNVHLDTDAVLLGELAFAPFDRMMLFGHSLPKSLVKMAIILVMNLTIMLLLFKELKVSTFDPVLSRSLGFSPSLLHYLLMFITSVTAVGAFDSVGAILVLAFMITPTATALLLTNSLLVMVLITFAISSASSLLGVLLAIRIDSGISGAITTIMGLFFITAYLFSPTVGVVTKIRNKQRIALEYALSIVLYHLLHHCEEDDMETECSYGHLRLQFNYSPRYMRKVVHTGVRRGLIEQIGEVFHLTESGKETHVDTFRLHH
ncbi:MAG: metal ABC transporter permease [Sphaerochaeta sp.]|jgi:manganese/zinc/iron transport system permease protein|nr:metal ABC transporter permease [Sphaerochaeta sp.]